MRKMRSRVANYNELMNPDRIERLCNYIYVDSDLVKDLSKAVDEGESPDVLRGLLTLNQVSGVDISNVLEYYDDVVVAMARYIILTNISLVSEDLQEIESERLGVRIEEITPKEEGETMIKPKYTGGFGKAKYNIPKYKLYTNPKTKKKYKRSYTKWTKQSKMFIRTRLDMSPQQLQEAYAREFHLQRSKKSIYAMRYRIKKGIY